MAGIELKHIQKAYTVDGRTFPVLKDICLQIPENSITVLLGKSGCGKTTLLRLVGDLEKPNSGEIRFAVTHKTAFVFQEPRLMPWLTVWDNTIFGLKSTPMIQEKSKPCWKRLVWMAFREPIPISFRAECSKEPPSRVLWRMRPPSF